MDFNQIDSLVGKLNKLKRNRRGRYRRYLNQLEPMMKGWIVTLTGCRIRHPGNKGKRSSCLSSTRGVDVDLIEVGKVVTGLIRAMI